MDYLEEEYLVREECYPETVAQLPTKSYSVPFEECDHPTLCKGMDVVREQYVEAWYCSYCGYLDTVHPSVSDSWMQPEEYAIHLGKLTLNWQED